MTGKAWILWLALIAGVFAANRLGGVTNIIPPAPAPDAVDTLSPAMRRFKAAASPLAPVDRSSLNEYYAGLSRAVASDPQEDPVFKTTAQLREGHRAGLLVLWRGFLGNTAAKYSDLRESIEGVLTEAIGTDDVPLNPAIREKAVAALQGMAQCTTGKR
jgi:hypothetical protein